MNTIEFLKYWLDTHPIIFALVMLTLVGGIGQFFSNLTYNKHRADADKQFWK